MPTFNPRKSLMACAVIAVLSPAAAQVNETLDDLNNYSDETSIIDLSKVVVTAGGFSQEVKSAPASISLVSKEALDNAPFRDVTDAIKDVPGVVITGGGASQDISIRGMAPQYTLMMVDGKRQNSRGSRPNSDGSGIEQGWIPPLAAIERVEVVRGPMSSRYGSDAMGGVVNVITKKITDQWMGNVRADYTVQHNSDQGNYGNTEFYLNGPLIKETLGLQVYGKYSHRKEDKHLEETPGRDLTNIGGKLTIVPVKGQTFELEAATSTQKRIYHVGKTLAEGYENKKTGQWIKNEDKTEKYTRDNFSVRYLGEFDNGITSDLLIAHEKNNNTTRKMIVKNTEVTGNVIIPIATHTVTVGAQYRDEKLTDSNNQLKKSVNNISRKSYAIFVEDEWWILDNFALTAGVRYEHDENYGGEVTPRLYAVWNIDDAWTLKGGISSGYRTPNIRQAVADWGHGTGGPGGNGVILGNPDLKPEKSLNYEVSLNFSPNDQLSLDATVFYTKFKDKIQEITVCKIGDACDHGFRFINTNQNVDTAKLYGAELSAQWYPVDTVKLSTSYTYNKTEQTSGIHKGKPLNRIPKHVFNLHADWQMTEKANLWTQVNYRGKEIETSGRSKKGIDYVYPDYTTWDLGGSYQVTKDASVFAGVYNITNQRVNQDTYGKNLDGRRYWLGVNINF